MMTHKATPWTVEEVQIFLSLIGDEKIQCKLDEATRSKRVYLQLSEQMQSHGFERTSKTMAS